MPKPILVGYDPKTEDRAPVRFGIAAARLTGAPLLIVSVLVELPGRALAGEADEPPCDRIPEVLDELRGELAGEDVAVVCRELRSTSAARGLHQAAEEEDAGLLIVGSTRRGVVGRLLPGSTADRLIHGAPCPVAVVPHEWTPRGVLDTIGVAFLDTEEGREALRGAHALAGRAGATLRVLTVVKPRLSFYSETEPTVAGRIERRDYEDVEGEHRVEAEAALRRAVAELGLGDDVPIAFDALIGDPAEEIVRISERLDLLVVGSRGYGPARAVLLGGVSRRVVTESHCPVIVLPRGVKASLEGLVEEPAAAVS